MKKEKEIIAKSNGKQLFVFIFVIFLASLPTSFNFLKNPDFRWLGIFFVSGILFIILLSLVFLIVSPKYAIVKDGQNLIIYQGFFKEIHPMATVISAELAPLTNGEIVSKNGNIIIKISPLHEKEKVLTVNVKNKSDVVERLNSIISKA